MKTCGRCIHMYIRCLIISLCHSRAHIHTQKYDRNGGGTIDISEFRDMARDLLKPPASPGVAGMCMCVRESRYEREREREGGREGGREGETERGK